MRLRRSRLLKLTISVFLILVLALVAIGQGDWGLGRYTLASGPPSAPLQFNLADSGGLGSYAFVSGVGGVAFAGVARPGSALAGQKVHLAYDASLSDGGRLHVTVGDHALQADLANWMLVPIARFADSRFDSCVSLFGPKTTATVYDIVYHSEFQNTLVGLRLLQADMLLFDLNETWQLPKFGGNTILGLGEIAPKQLDEASAEQISDALSNGDFQSWVMTDQGEDITFEVDGDQLQITGYPYYYFWNSDVKDVQKRQNDLYQGALEARRKGNIAKHNKIVEQINALTPTVQPVLPLTKNLKAARSALRQFNAPVYDAATNVMRYSAFFRYVKQQDPSAWKEFLEQLKEVKIQPQIVTPTRWAH